MSTAGILRADEVVFYHPLESDFAEHTTSEVWTGSAASVPGKIGDGNGAVTATDLSYGSKTTVAAGSDNETDGLNDPIRATNISADKVVMVWSSNSGPGGDDKAYGKVGTVTGTSVTWGPSAEFRSVAHPPPGVGDPPAQLDITALDGSRVMVFYRTDTTTGAVKIGTVSGTDLTWGPVQTVPTSITGEMACRATDSSHVVLAYGDATTTGKARVCVVSGTSVTFGAEAEFDASAGHNHLQVISVAKLTSTKFIVCHSVNRKSRIGSFSGTDITWGPSVALPAGLPKTTSHPVGVAALSETTVLAVGGGDNTYAGVGTVSGLDITWGPSHLWAAVSTLPTVFQIERINGGQCIICYRNYRNPADANTRILSVSGTDISASATQTHANVDGQNAGVCVLSATKFLLSWTQYGTPDVDRGEVAARVAVFDVSASINGTSGGYPSAVGDTRVTVAFWCKNPTGGSAEVIVERGYAIGMTSSTVSFGGTTAVWNVALGLDDNSDHLVVLDFENTGGTNWNLRTSVDGVGFTDQGAQDSGTQAVLGGDTAPKLEIVDAAGGSDQWIDELVMWAGDKSTFDRFTSEELANLNDLADTFGEGMDKYEENYGAPICWQATATMPDGTVWRDSGSGPCPAVVRVPRGASDVVVTDDGRPASPRVQEG